MTIHTSLSTCHSGVSCDACPVSYPGCYISWHTLARVASLPEHNTKERCLQGGLCENVSPEVMASARPLLTGNPAADADIIKFYQAKAALLSSQPLPVHFT